MAAGRSHKKIVFIIQARMQSTRLPGKVLLTVPPETGKPLIQWIVNQLKDCNLDAEVIVATSQNSADDRLCEYCTENKIPFFRGDEQDVLSRYVCLVRERNYQVIIRLTGDNAILDVPVIEKTVATHLSNNNDYTYTKGLPVGMNVEVIDGETLLNIAEQHDLSDPDKEHVTLYINKSDKYKKQEVNYSDRSELSALRVTLDYPSDYALISLLLSIQMSLHRSGIRLINYVLKHYPWLFTINENNYQKAVYLNKQDEIIAAADLLRKNGLLGAADLLVKEYE